MGKFYFFLWLRWLLRVISCSIILAIISSLFISIIIYINQGMSEINPEVLKALFEVFQFCFPISLSFTLLLALFRSLKYIFNIPTYNYELKLLECNSKNTLEYIGYGDLVKIWRKWFMLIIWLVTVEIVIALIFTHFFTSLSGIMDWFNIYYLSFFILLAGYFSFVILVSKCKRVKIMKC